MTRRGGLRARITLLVAGVVAISVGAAFISVYRGTSRELEHRSDRDLRADMSALESTVTGPPATPAGIAMRAARFLRSQPFRANAHVTYVAAPGQRPVSNQPELLGLAPRDAHESAEQQAREDRAARAFLAAPAGLSVRDLPDVGPVRLLVHEVRTSSRLVARLGVGEPTAPVRQSTDVVFDAFLLAGALAFAVALAGGFLVATRVSAPLRGMARVAAQVDAGDMDPRMRVRRGRAEEVRVLGDSFDHMLDRLQNAFDRQAGFVADASHELRTPLTIIRGQLEVLALEDRPSSDDVRRVAGVVRSEVERMGRLVEDMLLLAQAGEASFIRPERIELQGFMEDLASTMAPDATRTIELAPVPAIALDADPDRLAQALRNLLRNALAHTDPGGTVRLGAEQRGARVRLTIEDDGPGVPPAERERIFDRFHRLDAGRARQQGGAGLGLAIVRAVAEAHAGRAWVEPATTGGARFVVELPARS